MILRFESKTGTQGYLEICSFLRVDASKSNSGQVEIGYRTTHTHQWRSFPLSEFATLEIWDGERLHGRHPGNLGRRA